MIFMQNNFLINYYPMKKSYFISYICFSALIMALTMSSCQKNVMEIVIFDDKQIDEVMAEQTSLNLSEFLSILDVSGMRSTVHAYGNYALFAPNNDAVDAYLKQIGKSSVSDLTQDEAAAIVKYHLLNVTDITDSVTTSSFVDGRMAYPTFAGSYLTTKQEGENIRVNRQALIVSPRDIKASNGYLHILDHLLTPPDPITESITARVRALPDNFSLMKEAFERSGMADTLAANPQGAWKTLFIQDNDAFASDGINNMDDLISALQTNTPDVGSVDSLLYNYIAYHTVPSLEYVADLLVASSLNTMVKNQVITFSRTVNGTDTQILLNQINLGQTTEPGIPLDRSSDYSDWTCSNGVIQKINGNIKIVIRAAYRIYWDIAEQPEIMALRNFRKPGCSVIYNEGDLSELTWHAKSGCPTPWNQVQYYCGTVPQTIDAFDEKSQYVYADYLRFNLDLNAIQWMELKTPVLIGSDAGVKYKVWICYRRELECNLKTTFKEDGYDDQPLPYIFDMSLYMPNPYDSASGNTPETVEQDGWKIYNAKKYNSVVCSYLLGTIEVHTTGRHTLRLEPTTNRRVQQQGNVDLIEFIPVDDDQLWPRVDVKGNWIDQSYENRACAVWPLEDCGDDTAE